MGINATAKPKLYRTVPGLTPAWAAGNAMTTGTKADNVFFEYKDYIYGWQNGTVLWRVGPLTNDPPTSTDNYQTISYTNVAQPVHHKADDIAYFFQDNIVHKLSGATWASTVLTLPSNMKIVGGASYGNYLAIVCSPIEPGTTNSVMYLWDRDSSLTTLTSKIDLGMGETIHVSESEDGGIWLTQNTTGVSGTASVNNSITIKYFNGTLTSLEIPVKMPTDYFSEITLSGNSWEERNVFYFPARIKPTGTAEVRHVILATRMSGGQILLTADQEITGVGASEVINGIFSLAGIWYISYGTNAICLQAVLASSFPTCTYESKIFNDEDSAIEKKLIGITVMTSPLPVSATVKLYYRKDAGTTWILIFSHTETGSISHDAINIESSGATLPQYSEIQFKIESLGGAEINGFQYKSELIPNRLY